ncbi:ABC transporter permease [Mucilaginibacter sp.]|uniref:ABC transporter permease n=1 Tax=Mucilaginibacter sp. TaxID=1882438 RepID=UPI003D0E64F7
MLKINLKLAFRNIFRNKLYTTINIIGLSVASAFCILVYLYVKNEQSFDSFHKDNEQLFRVEETDLFGSFRGDKFKKNFFSFLMKDAEVKRMIQTPMILAGDLKKTFPEVESAVRIKTMYNPIIKIGNQSFKENGDNAAYVDADFFKIFNFPLVSGSSSNVLASANQAVISQRLAKKYFGAYNPVGKTLAVDTVLYTISAVAKDFPSNSSFQYDLIVPRESDPDYLGGMGQGTNSFSDYLIIKLKQGTNTSIFQKKLTDYSKTYFKAFAETMQKYDTKHEFKAVNIYLRPFAQAHYNESEDWSHYTDLKNIYQLGCLTVVILLIACLNYILLTLTNAISRSQDVGVRKTIGAGRKQIVLQYYTETQLLAFIAVITGFILASVCLPFFSNLTGTVLQLSSFSFGTIAALLFGLAIALGLLAGIYPAMAMSGLKPLNIMRGFSAYRISPLLSKSLVVLQFTICVILVISTLAINKQMHYVNNSSMGFDKDQVVILQNPYSWKQVQQSDAFKKIFYNYAATEPAIQDVTDASFNFGAYNYSGFMLDGKKVMLQALNVDYNYFSFNKIPILNGRTFNKDIAGDSAELKVPSLGKSSHSSSIRHAIVVNETLYNMLGKPQLGVLNTAINGVIIGVCKDYHTDDFTKKIEPAYHTVNANRTAYYWVKIKAGKSIPKTMEKIKDNWNKLTGNLPFSYTFMDEDVAKKYEAYLRWMTTITTSCILAIIIACLGLFGLSGLTTINRTKEIGIRKVLGASVSNLFLLLNRGTILLATGSFIIAAPIAFYLVHEWLDNFAYRIKPDWTLFVSAAIIAMLTAIFAVSYHTIKAAMSNPVKSLKSE